MKRSFALLESSSSDSSEESSQSSPVQSPSAYAFNQYYYKINSENNYPQPPLNLTDKLIKLKYNTPESKQNDRYMMEILRCRCGLSPFAMISKKTSPGAAYYVCGSLKDRCNFHVWHSQLINDSFRLCRCGNPVVKCKLSRKNKDYHYMCLAFGYKDGCNYLVRVNQFNDNRSHLQK